MTRVRNLAILLRGQLWPIPALITAGAAMLAYLLLTYGSTILAGGRTDVWWLYSGHANTARDLLSSLLSGLMTMTSLIVSVTFVILTLAANQLGPRLISIFVADRQIQSVLGLFLGTILYIILVLRTLDDTLGSEGVPHVAVTVASGLTIVCLLAMLFYIHKIARSIIADNVVEAVAGGLRRDVCDILHDEDSRSETGIAAMDRASSGSIALGRCGYVQVIDYDRLVAVARRENAVLEIRVRAGHYVLKCGDHVIAHGNRPLETEVEDQIREAFVIGSERTPAQDLEHGIRQLVEIAIRALSPGINDQFTAIAVIDRLGAAFEDIFLRPLQSKVLRDREGEIRILAERSDARGLVEAAFNPIRQAGAEHPAILIRIADILGQLAPALSKDEARLAVQRQLDKLEATARYAHLAPDDRDETLERIERAKASIAEKGGSG
jgi:uncharacterized membrane protein